MFRLERNSTKLQYREIECRTLNTHFPRVVSSDVTIVCSECEQAPPVVEPNLSSTKTELCIACSNDSTNGAPPSVGVRERARVCVLILCYTRHIPCKTTRTGDIRVNSPKSPNVSEQLPAVLAQTTATQFCR
jgi:hypothetical protein